MAWSEMSVSMVTARSGLKCCSMGSVIIAVFRVLNAPCYLSPHSHSFPFLLREDRGVVILL